MFRKLHRILLKISLIILYLQLICAFSLKNVNVTRYKRQECSFDQFKCNSGKCIREDQECDGLVDCDDGSDETNDCKNLLCQSFLFRCSYGACINPDFECDNKQDCRDGSDERTPNCLENVSVMGDCSPHEFRCNSGQCIDEIDICDGVPNCADNSDETYDVCSAITCPGFTYRCAYGGCVNVNARCNDIYECFDKSDEENCEDSVVPTTHLVTSTTTTTTTQPPSTTPTNPFDVKKKCVVPASFAFGKLNLFGGGTARANMAVAQGTIIEVKCLPGYFPEPNQKLIVCLDGRWSNPIPTCMRMCPPIDVQTGHLTAKCERNGTRHDCETPITGVKAKLACEPLYEDFSLARNPYRYCKDGTWDYPLPKCSPECGLKHVTAQTLIIGGSIAAKDHYPWTVGIYRSKDDSHICGGSILNQKVVISAAHCFVDATGMPYPKENYKIAAGKHYRRYDDARDKKAQYSSIERLQVHPEYKGELRNHAADMAILILETVLILTTAVRPVCVDWSNQLESQQLVENNLGIVTGWGFTKENNDPSEELKEIEVPYISEATCFNAIPINFKRFFTPDKICAGYIDKGAGVCQGDSGGGLVFNEKSRFYIRGVVSLAPKSNISGGCDSNQFALYTKISRYLDFISDLEAQYRL